MKKLVLFIIIFILLSSCTAETITVKECADIEPHGFFMGFWHGLIVPFTFIISLFDVDVAIYAANNIGGWYDFGFLLGSGVLISSSSSYYDNN